MCSMVPSQLLMISNSGFRIITPGPRILIMVNPHNFQIRILLILLVNPHQLCEYLFNDPLWVSMNSPLFTLRNQPQNHQNPHHSQTTPTMWVFV